MSYPRHTACRLLIDQRCYEGAPPDHLEVPTPLGRLGQRIVLPKSWDWQAPTRPLDPSAGPPWSVLILSSPSRPPDSSKLRWQSISRYTWHVGRDVDEPYTSTPRVKARPVLSP